MNEDDGEVLVSKHISTQGFPSVRRSGSPVQLPLPPYVFKIQEGKFHKAILIIIFCTLMGQ